MDVQSKLSFEIGGAKGKKHREQYFKGELCNY